MNNVPDRLNELRAAAMLLTRLPVGDLVHPVPRLAQARWAYPVVGAVVGALCWFAFALSGLLGLGPLVSALVALMVGALITGGMHQDGLADLADGFGGGQTREAKLEIMRDSRIGSYGVLALILVIGLKAAAISELAPGGPGLAMFMLAGAASRFWIVAVLDHLPSARADGLGHSAAQDPDDALLAAGAVTGLIAVFVGWGALMVLIVSGLATLGLAQLAKRQVGGQTGDVLGATQQISEAAIWLTLVAVAA